MPKSEEPEPRKIAWRVPVVAGAGRAAAGVGVSGDGRGAALGVGVVLAGGGDRTSGEPPACGPRRILSSDAWETAKTTPHFGHLSLATFPKPQRGQGSGLRPPPPPPPPPGLPPLECP